MKKFNLSDWALEHASLVWFFMIAFMVAGVMAYVNLGREEDPSFTIKIMVIQANWPGASVEATGLQVTDRIERKLEELDSLDFTRSITTAGKSVVFVHLLPTTPSKDVAATWTRVRNMMADIRPFMPQEVRGPFYNDRFGDVFGNIYAFTADGLTHRELRDYVENEVRPRALSVPGAGRIDTIGTQDEVIYLEFSTRQIAALGLNREDILASLQAQNAVVPSGTIDTGEERIGVRVTGHFTSEESLREINLRVGDRFFRLSDVATVTRGYANPPGSLFRYNGQPAIGLAVGMKPNGNLLEFGEALEDEMQAIMAELPVGVEAHIVADQPVIVEEAVNHFLTALFEAVAIVLVVSFLSLGLRAGFVVALSIPLTLAITFAVMYYTGISMQRVSLGALIIALGLLVDDAMIAVEMMISRLEAGETLRKAATAVYTSTAFPMLTGTLVTVAGFIPIGFNSSLAGEYTQTLFVVMAVSLLVSWVVAVIFAPLLGVLILPKVIKKHADKPKRLAGLFRAVLEWAVRHRWITITTTLIAFLVSAYSMTFVGREFFPPSDRPELVVDWTLPQNSSVLETEAVIARFEADVLDGDPDIALYSSYVGQGAVRFVLAFDVLQPNPYVGQTVIVAKDIEARDRVRARITEVLRTDFPGVDAYPKLMEMGPPVGRPVQYRVSGPDPQTLRAVAAQLASRLEAHPALDTVTFDWFEPQRIVEVEVLQDKARALGVTSEDIANMLNGVTSGIAITQVRDATYLVNVVVRAGEDERGSIDTLRNLQLTTGTGEAIPLAAVARFDYGLEQPNILRRDRVPTITLKAGVIGHALPADVVADLAPQVAAFASELPGGYHVATAGIVEESAKSQAPIIAIVPMMLLAMALILMIQLQSFQRLFMVAAVAPLGVIGVAIALLPTGSPLGFVAILGVLALIGILIRNSVILVVQIEDLIKAGTSAWDAVIEATEHRVRPIVLTALAASLALIPISRQVFWGPMAYAMMGGIIVGTVLTLVFLPALYAAWFRIKEPDSAGEHPASEVVAVPATPESLS
ncbi:MAG: efflux RND transporter permease subunit [Devosia sp.]|nr:efflux RND transporter permease subunit [Devosia sp.]